MGMDVRTPIGLFFALVGILLVVFGALSNSALYQRSLGVNINLGWGVVLLVFGGFMLAMGMRGTKKIKGSR